MRIQAAVRGSRASDLFGAVLIALMAFQFGGVVILGKAAADGGVSITFMLALRFAVSGVVLAAVLTVLRQSMAPAAGEGWRLWLLGMVCYSAESGLYFAGLAHGTATAVTLLFFTYPVLVALGGILLGRGLPGRLLGAALAASTAGAAIVVVAGGGIDIRPLGVVFALASALTYAIYLTGAGMTLHRTHTLVGAMIVSFAAAAGLSLYALGTGQARWPVGWSQWGPIVGMGVLTAGAFGCLLGGIRRLGALRTAIVSAGEPLAVAMLAAIFLAEATRRTTAIGGLLILAGAVAASVARAEGARLQPPVP